VRVPWSAVGDGVDQVACGDDGEQHGTRLVVPVDDAPVLVRRDPHVRGQAERLEPLQQPVFIQGNDLGRYLAPQAGLMQVALIVDVAPAPGRYERHSMVAIGLQPVLDRSADGKRQLAVLDQDQVRLVHILVNPSLT